MLLNISRLIRFRVHCQGIQKSSSFRINHFLCVYEMTFKLDFYTYKTSWINICIYFRSLMHAFKCYCFIMCDFHVFVYISHVLKTKIIFYIHVLNVHVKWVKSF